MQSQATLTVSFTAAEAINTTSVKIDGNAADSVTHSGNDWTATRVMQASDTEGPISFVIDFEDILGNAGISVTATTDGTSVTFDISAVAPIITIATEDNQISTIIGKSEANATVEVFDGNVSVGITTADVNGDWIVVTSLLSEGTHPLSASQIGTLGNQSPRSNAVLITIVLNDENTIYLTEFVTEVEIEEDNTVIVIPENDAGSTVDISLSDQEDVFLDLSNQLTSNSTTEVVVDNAIVITKDSDTTETLDIITTIFKDTTMSSSDEWDGKYELPTATTVDIPSTDSETFETQIAIDMGSDEKIILSQPMRIEFPGLGGQELGAFFQEGDEPPVIITTICDADSLEAVSAQLGPNQECIFDDGFSIIVYATHNTSFGVHKATSTDSGSPTSGNGRGSTGAGVGAGAGARGFGGILGTPLTINEITYDKCEENIARILVSSDAKNPLSVTVHTTKTGSIAALLSDEQPFEDLNKITRVDKYLYEIPITSDETFLMIIVTEEKGTTENTINAAIDLTSCEGDVTIADVPEDEFDEFLFTVPRIFDTKFQIDDGAQHLADADSKSLYVSEQDLTITAIIDSQNPIKRVELRTITLGQSDDEYIAMKMNVEPMIFFNTYHVSGTIPSFLMQDPAIAYWIYVIDEELSEVESAHYTMGVKPVLKPDVSLELDVPSIKQSSSTVRPSLFINNDQSPAYGIVSLVVDGIVVSERAEFFETGQTKVSFDWKVPSSAELSSYELQGKVDMYGSTEITDSAKLYSYPRTQSMSAYDMKTIEAIEIDGNVLSEPVLLYASNAQTDEFKFQVTAPNGQCIIGSSEECSVKDSTRSDRGGLSSVQYEEQTLRIKYSGPDSSFERFSITSIDPIVGDWTVTLEAEEGFIPLAQAVKDLTIKVKHRINSETITVYSD